MAIEKKANLSKIFLIIFTCSFLLMKINPAFGLQNCAVWKEIAPCTCKIEITMTSITCEKMNSFAEIVNILKNRFSPKDKISLKIRQSDLYDLSHRSFQELNMNIERLYLNLVNLSELEALSFLGLTNVNYLSLCDNTIPAMPKHIFAHMPKVKTLDLGRIKLQNLPEDSFKSIEQLHTLVLETNNLSYVDKKSIPSTVTKLHMGRDTIRDLNGTLRDLSELEWLFINENKLTTLEGQLPKHGEKLVIIYAASNQIEHLPQDFKNLPNLESLFFQHNLVTRLDGVLSKLKKLKRVQFEHNRINMLSEDDFTEAESLESLLLGFNHISSLNGSVLPLRNLRCLNLTHNYFTEFSLVEVRGLPHLSELALSHNRLQKIIGLPPNLLEWETKITQLDLDHNEITSLNSSLSGLRSLLKLNLSHNKLTRILPDDLIGLDQLTMLDISFNLLTTLEETSKTFLPALEELIAHHNFLTILDRDFHGLPVLCWADLSNNQIVAIGRDLVSKTHCKIHGIHQDNWGILRIYLQDNPILCDAALSEIISELEQNHTRIVGASHCPPLSEQPVTKKPNAFLGYVPDSILNYPGHVQEYIQQQLNNNEQINPYNQPIYQQVPSHTHRPYTNPNILPNAVFTEEKSRKKLTDDSYYTNQYDKNVNLLDNGNGNTKANTISPLPYQGHNLKILNDRINIPLLNTLVTESPLRLRSAQAEIAEAKNESEEVVNDQPTKNRQDMQHLVEEIEQLKTKVQELVIENEKLVENLNHILPQKTESKILEKNHPVVPPELPVRIDEEDVKDLEVDSMQTVSPLRKILIETTEKQLHYDDLGEP